MKWWKALKLALNSTGTAICFGPSSMLSSTGVNLNNSIQTISFPRGAAHECGNLVSNGLGANVYPQINRGMFYLLQNKSQPRTAREFFN